MLAIVLLFIALAVLVPKWGFDSRDGATTSLTHPPDWRH